MATPDDPAPRAALRGVLLGQLAFMAALQAQVLALLWLLLVHGGPAAAGIGLFLLQLPFALIPVVRTAWRRAVNIERVNALASLVAVGQALVAALVPLQSMEHRVLAMQLLIAVLGQITGSTRWGILSLVLLFAAGGILLLRTEKTRAA